MKQYIVDAFTNQPFSGNPAAVCVMDRWPSEESMMKLAMENNLSETAFIVKEEEGYRLRWFTPGTEVELCGHATLASSFAILSFYEQDNNVVEFNTMSGLLTVRKKGDLYEMEFPTYHLKEIPVTDTHGTYLAEQEMLRMVREGDLELVRHIDRMAVTGTMGQLAQTGDALRQMKNAVQVSVTLFSRAAIEGGLSPETAYTLCDRYFQNVEAAKSLSELTGVATTMHRDFVERVHAVRTQKLSREIEAACSYIERHLEEELSIASLASYAGYMEYYFSKKFKRELGLTPAEYIRKKRLEKAALLLRSSDLDAQQIATRLQFCSQSYFTDCFRKEYGISPTKYRKEGKA